MTTAKPPAPLERHPYYEDQTWLLDWLECPGRDANRIVMDTSLGTSAHRWWLDEPTDLIEALPDELIMTRRRAWAPAPYVGNPFHYEWYVGEDNLGRCIAGEARIVYEEQTVSRPCHDLAAQMIAALPDGPELTTGLRKLLEAKDCFVRAALDR